MAVRIVLSLVLRPLALTVAGCGLPPADHTPLSWEDRGFLEKSVSITSKKPVCYLLIPQPVPSDIPFKESLTGLCCTLAVLRQLLGGLKLL